MKIDGVITAFLKNGDRYLLMKRAANRRFYPNTWAGIGGGIHDDEMTEPERACLREVREETGITSGFIHNLRLRYVHVAPRETYLTTHYIFFGDSSETTLTETDEGETFWIPEAEVLEKDYTFAMRRLLEHYFNHAVYEDTVYLFNENDDSITPLKQGGRNA